MSKKKKKEKLRFKAKYLTYIAEVLLAIADQELS